MRLQQAGPPEGLGRPPPRCPESGEEYVVELRRFVNNVAQSETTLHEDKPVTTPPGESAKKAAT